MNQQRLLAIYAHPDDETFGSGGTMARYAAQGAYITLVCATRGEAGEISDAELASRESIAEVREQELRCAAEALGVSELIFLDYRDSGMAGTPENEQPEAFINQPAKEVVTRLVGIIRRVRPQVVITFDPKGGYGHPDHIAIHDHTVAAFRSAVDPNFTPEQGEPWKADRLFYSVIPRSTMEVFHKLMEAAGVELDIVQQIEESGAGWPDERVDVVMDVAAQFGEKRTALRCHRTQFGDEHPFQQLPEETFRELMCREHFYLAWPVPAPDELAELFDGLENSHS